MIDPTKLTPETQQKLEKIKATYGEKKIDTPEEYQALQDLLSGLKGTEKKEVEKLVYDYQEEYQIRQNIKEEIKQILSGGDPDKLDANEYVALDNYKKQCKNKGIKLTKVEQNWIKQLLNGRTVKSWGLSNATNEGVVKNNNATGEPDQPVKEEGTKEPDKTEPKENEAKKPDQPVKKEGTKEPDKTEPKENETKKTDQPVKPNAKGRDKTVVVPMPVQVNHNHNLPDNSQKAHQEGEGNINGNNNNVIINNNNYYNNDNPNTTEDVKNSENNPNTNNDNAGNTVKQPKTDSDVELKIANKIYKAVDGPGTNEEALEEATGIDLNGNLEIDSDKNPYNNIGSVNEQNIVEVKDKYSTAYERDMFYDVLDDLSGDDYKNAAMGFANKLLARNNNNAELNQKYGEIKALVEASSSIGGIVGEGIIGIAVGGAVGENLTNNKKEIVKLLNEMVAIIRQAEQ